MTIIAPIPRNERRLMQKMVQSTRETLSWLKTNPKFRYRLSH
ncbi:hypothetical protein [Xenorhabdus szentirmaii]|nr:MULTISPECIES: hypothetical protein [Xenorhabdus]